MTSRKELRLFQRMALVLIKGYWYFTLGQLASGCQRAGGGLLGALGW